MYIPEIDTSKPHELTIDGRRHKGRMFNVNGETVEVYKVRTLADALGKTTAAIEKWEIYQWLPKPLFYVKGDNIGICRRWYSREQIINLHNVIRLIPYGRGNGHRHHKNAFFKAVRAVFGHRTLVTLKRKDKGATDGTGPSDQNTPRIPAGTPDGRKGVGAGTASAGAGKSRERDHRPSRSAAPYFNPSVRELKHPHRRAAESRHGDE